MMALPNFHKIIPPLTKKSKFLITNHETTIPHNTDMRYFYHQKISTFWKKEHIAAMGTQYKKSHTSPSKLYIKKNAIKVKITRISTLFPLEDP